VTIEPGALARTQARCLVPPLDVVIGQAHDHHPAVLLGGHRVTSRRARRLAGHSEHHELPGTSGPQRVAPDHGNLSARRPRRVAGAPGIGNGLA
jgi:hypothetical protein